MKHGADRLSRAVFALELVLALPVLLFVLPSILGSLAGLAPIVLGFLGPRGWALMQRGAAEDGVFLFALVRMVAAGLCTLVALIYLARLGWCFLLRGRAALQARWPAVRRGAVWGAVAALAALPGLLDSIGFAMAHGQGWWAPVVTSGYLLLVPGAHLAWAGWPRA